ncbi:hypothetical protein LguiB_017498 [Lonicera macranthoides]
MDRTQTEPLLQSFEPNYPLDKNQVDDHKENSDLKSRVWIETKKLWQIVGPTIFSRIANYSMNIVTQAFAGHLGDVELAAVSIANNVILGMATALETLCGRAFGAKRYHLLGIYMQRSWIVLFISSILLLPLYIYTTPILKFLGQPDDVAQLSGLVALWFIPQHMSFAFQCSLQRFLQSQLKTNAVAWITLVAFVVHVFISWLFVYPLGYGVVGAAVALDISWWVSVFGMFGYTVFGGCPETWTGLSIQAFSGLWEFVKLSAASGIMLCLEFWYYRILVLMTGNLNDTTTAVDALSVCMSINGWELMIPFAFLAATGIRVANELGAGNGKAAKFAVKVSVVQSSIIGIFFCALILIFNNRLAMLFTSSTDVLHAVDKLSYLLAFTILLNSVQPVLSGVAIGSGWQSWVAYVNLACYYLFGLPLGIVMGWYFNLGIQGIWGGMIFGGTAVQTVTLAIITINRNWETEAKKATMQIEKLPSPDPDDQSLTS